MKAGGLRLTVVACLGIGVTLAGDRNAPVRRLPRYRLGVGQELVYESTNAYSYKALLFSKTIRRTLRTRVWVARRNEDGSWRLLMWYRLQREEDPPSTGFAYCDLFPDGRFCRNATLSDDFDPSTLFPRLPASEQELRGGWAAEESLSGERLRWSVGDRQGSRIPLRADVDSTFNDIYDWSATAEAAFDLDRGLAVRVSSTAKKRSKSDKRVARTDLREVRSVDRKWLRALERELSLYFETMEHVRTLGMGEDASAEGLKSRLKNRRDVWSRVRAKLRLPIVRTEVDRIQALASEGERHLVAEARRLDPFHGKVIGWTLEDLEGRRHRLADYRGKVVVLDFWYRECGWCIRAMPEIRRIAKRFRPRGVVTLGMNVDRKSEDARFVAGKMKLDYPTLRARGLARKYGVNAYPTVVILDGNGAVRHYVIGYSSGLESRLAQVLEQLLARPPPEARDSG